MYSQVKINLYTTGEQNIDDGYKYTFNNGNGSEKGEGEEFSDSASSYNPNVPIGYSPDASNQVYFEASTCKEPLSPNIYSLESSNNMVGQHQEERAWGDNLNVNALKPLDKYEFSKEIQHWNEEFQNILDEKDSPQRLQKLSSIANDFVYASNMFGKIIISELHLPLQCKTIKPCDLGGVAGGQKYKCQDIIFKFAVDTELSPGLWMYGGAERADSFAQKSTNHEVTGLNHVMDIYSGSSGLIRFPLIAIIDYRGYRLLALSSLPIDPSTIVYGSCDGGKTVHNSSEQINKEMERIASVLNLRGHSVGLPKKFIYGPGDIEVHKGYDGRFYMIDFARIFPPEYPLIFNNKPGTKIGREIFYNLLRPELVKSSLVPLSSDGFSGWQTSLFEDDLNRDITKQTNSLHSTVIPKVIEVLNQTPEEDYNPATHKLHLLIQNRTIIHLAGINYRYLGVVCRDIKVKCIKELLITELLARVWKRIIRSRLRKLMDLTKRPSEDPYKLIIAEIFAIILDPSLPNQDQFWQEFSPGNLKYIAYEIFPRCFNDMEKDSSCDLRKMVDTKLLIIRIMQMMNIKLNLSTFNQFLLTPDDQPFIQFGVDDIDEVDSTIKYPYIIDFACGKQFLHETSLRIANPLKEIDILEADRLINDAKAKIYDANDSIPSSFQVQSACLETLFIKGSIIIARGEPFRILVFCIASIEVIRTPEQVITTAMQRLLALFRLSLASSNLFLGVPSLLSEFHRDINLSRKSMENALLQDDKCLDELLVHILPVPHLYPPELLILKPKIPHPNLIVYKKRKLCQLLSLIYLLNHTDSESIIHDVFQDYISSIKQIDNFEPPAELESINQNNNVTYSFFDRLENLRLLSISSFTIDKVISNHISKMKFLKYLTLNNITFKQPLFSNLLQNVKGLELLSICDTKLEDSVFDGVYQGLTSLISLELINTGLSDIVLFNLSDSQILSTNLKKLNISNSNEFSDQGVQSILKSTKDNLKILNISGCSTLTDEIVPIVIENQKNLKQILFDALEISETSKSTLINSYEFLRIEKNRRLVRGDSNSSLKQEFEYILTYKTLKG